MYVHLGVVNLLKRNVRWVAFAIRIANHGSVYAYGTCLFGHWLLGQPKRQLILNYGFTLLEKRR